MTTTDLNEQQLAAVLTESRRAMVEASPGSGKTRVLTERIAYLVEKQKVSPYEVMAFTFTRKAAGEIKARLEKRIGTQAHRVSMGTMHAIALNILTRFGDAIGYKPNQVTVYCQWETDFLLKEIASELGIFNKSRKWNPAKKEIDATFARYYEQGIDPELGDPGYYLFKAFIQRCKENNALTYGALLVGLRLLISTISKHLHIRHILVDETQDIDPLQWTITNELCEAFNASLFVVGDIDQSIYSFRGAVPEYLIEHQNEFDIYRLETNYRSGSSIVEAANRLIKHNTDRIEKTMVPHTQETGTIETLKGMDSAAIVKMILDRGLDKHEDVAIIGRVHVILQKIDEAMTELRIPHTYIGKKWALTNSEEFRRFHAFLKLLVNPYDNFSFLMVRELIGISLEEYAGIRVKASCGGQSHFQVWIETAPDKYKSFFRNDSSLAVQAFGIKYMATGAWPYGGNGWGFDVEDVFKFIFEWLTKNPGINPEGSIQSYLKWLATYDIQDEVAEEKTGIQILTCHGCKGLEFKTVIIAGCNEGICPSKQAIKEGNIEDERRIFYVATTRAEKQLLLTVRPEKKEYQGKLFESPVSRFIEEST